MLGLRRYACRQGAVQQAFERCGGFGRWGGSGFGSMLEEPQVWNGPVTKECLANKVALGDRSPPSGVAGVVSIVAHHEIFIVRQRPLAGAGPV